MKCTALEKWSTIVNIMVLPLDDDRNQSPQLCDTRVDWGFTEDATNQVKIDDRAY